MLRINYENCLRKRANEAVRNAPKRTRDYARYQHSPTDFNAEVLRRKTYWKRQIQICRAIRDPRIRTILVPAGNGVGKSYLGAGLALWYLYCFPDSKVVTTGPTFEQLASILWENIFKAYDESELAGTSRVKYAKLSIRRGKEWFCKGINPDKIESASGYHARYLFALIDESSALTAAKNEAIDSWDCHKKLLLGNPLRNDGPFYDLCTRQRIEPDPSVCLIKIPSTESPAIVAGHRRSEDGFVGLDWLDDRRRDYGEDSLWWKSHVLAEFPDSSEGQLVPGTWVDRAVHAKPIEDDDDNTARTLAIDLAAGRGGDRSVLLVRSAKQLMHLESSNRWPLEETARRAADVASRFGIAGPRVIYDRSGLGEGFRAYLETAGLRGAVGFLGGSEAKGQQRRFANLRSASAWRLRQRLDPDTHPEPFRIPHEWGSILRPELQAITYEVTSHDKIKLTDKEAIAARIGRSPDLADALCMSFVTVDTAA